MSFRKKYKLIRKVVAGVTILAVITPLFVAVPVNVKTAEAQIPNQEKVIFLTTTGTNTWTVPADWSNNNKIEVLGAGGGGRAGSTSGSGGGGGGAYSAINITGLTPGGSVTYRIGAGGNGGTTAGTSGTTGGDTFFNRTAGAANTCADTVSLCAKGGAGATSATGAAGGAVASNKPANVGWAGGAGGTGSSTGDTAGGGGGAAGPHGIGRSGGAGQALSPGAGGGGGANGTANGSGGATNGGNGAANFQGTGAGTGANSTSDAAAVAGTNGGGGGGGAAETVTTAIRAGANGGNGSLVWTSTHAADGSTPSVVGAGPGGGGGGAGAATASGTGSVGGNGGTYGAGGGGSYQTAGSGAQGIIVITYVPSTVTVKTIFLTTSPGTNQTWTVPGDWSDDNEVIVLAAGGGGRAGSTSGARGGGGGAIATRNITGLTPGGSVTYRIGAGGNGGTTAGTSGTTGGDTFFNRTAGAANTCADTVSLCAKGGTGGTSATAGGVGGAIASNKPAYAGFNGGAAGSGNNTGDTGGGGGGAASIFGAGRTAGAGQALAPGAGGGGAGVGGLGSNGSTNGGNGGVGFAGTGGGTGANATTDAAAVAGTNGGGGGGGAAETVTTAIRAGANGSNSVIWTQTSDDATIGPGGGGGGGGATTGNGTGSSGGVGGYGAGGGGAYQTAGAGGQGFIVIRYVPAGGTTTLGDGTDGSSSTIAPGSSATEIDRFSLETDAGTDTVTGLTVTLAGDVSAYTNIATVGIYNLADSLQCSATPSSNTVAIGSCSLGVTTSPTDWIVKITPKSHAAMPAVPGASYATTATVTAITATNTTAGTDTDSATITVDNASPAGVTSSTATAGDTLVNLAWTNPADSDFTTSGTVVVLRRATSAVADVPVEGTTYSVGNTIGTATVACVVTGSAPATSCQETGLSNGTVYHYKIFTQDSRGNYDAGVVPTGSPVTPVGATTTLGDGTDKANLTVAPGVSSVEVDRFSLATSTGTDTVTGMTVTLAGNASAYTNIATVGIYPAADTTFSALSQTSRDWRALAVNSTTHDVYAVVPNGDIYKQTAGAGTFNALGQTSRGWRGIAIDSSNNDVYATVGAGDIYKQTGGSGSFVALGQTSRNWRGIAVDSSTHDVYASVTLSGDIYKMTGGTGNFVALGQTPRSWYGMSINPYTHDVYAVEDPGDIYKQTGGTGDFVALGETTRSWLNVSVDSATYDVYAVVSPTGDIYKQTGGTGSFVALGQASSSWNGLGVDSSNHNVYASVSTGDIYKSTFPSALCTATPSSNTVALTGCGISVTTTPTEYKVMITPKTHAAMPAVPGASYATTATVTSITATNTTAGTDTDSATITVDNASPAGVTSATVSAGDTVANLAWTNPADSDFTTNGTIVVLRRATSAVADVPVEGTIYSVGNTIGTATVACVVRGSAPATTCQDTGLSNGTVYHYKIFTQDSRRNYDAGVVPTGSPVTPVGAITTLGDGTDGSNSTIGPGASATEIDRFSLVTSVGSDTVTGLTVTLAGNASAYTNIDTVGVYTLADSLLCSATPAANAVALTTCGMSFNTTPVNYVVKITPKSHAAMPAVPGASYATTATVTAITATNTTAGTDTDSATITVDNASPAGVTSSTATSGDAIADLAWTNPADSDFTTSGTVVVLRRATSAVADVPVEGTTYSVGNTIGTATVACVVTGSAPATSCQDSSVSNGTVYHYKIFTQDSRGNYDAGVVPTGSPVSPIGARVRYVNPASSGGDGTTAALSGANAAYASLAAAVTAEATNLVTAGVFLDIQLTTTGGVEDTGNTDITGYTTDATHYIQIRTVGANRHPGYWDDTKYRLATTFGITVREDYVKIFGLQIRQTGDDNGKSAIYLAAGPSPHDVHIGYNIIKGTAGTYTYGNSSTAIYGGLDVAGNNYIYNNLIYDWTFGAGKTGNNAIKTVNHASGKTYVFNNTIVGTAGTSSYAVKDGYNDIITENNLYYNNLNDEDNVSASSNNNATDKGVALTGASSRISQTFSFVDASTTRNYQLTASDAGAKGYGQNNSADGNLAFSDDLAGVTRTVPWDIGALKFRSSIISGYVYSDEGISANAVWGGCGNASNIAISVNGAAKSNTTCSKLTGAFTFTGQTVQANDIITIFLDTNGGDKGVVYTRAVSTTADITGISLVRNTIGITYETGSSLTNADINIYDQGNDADIPAASAGTNLVGDPGVELHVFASKNFAPGGTVSVNDMRVKGTYTGTGATTSINNGLWIDSGGTFVAPPTLNLTGNLINDGTFTHSSGTVNMSLGGSFQFSRPIVIDHNDVVGTNQTNFPVMIAGTYDGTGGILNLKNTSNGGPILNSNGYDIAFFLDENLKVKLSHEVEKYDGSTGSVIYWVRVPLVSTTTDTTIYIAYRNPLINSDRSDSKNVWSNGYVGVWHLPDGSTLSGNDSAFFANDGTIVNATAAAGKIGGGGSFNNTDKHINVGTMGNFGAGRSSGITISSWVNQAGTNDANAVIGVEDDSALGTNGLQMILNGNSALGVTAGSVLTRLGSDTDEYLSGATNANDVPADGWYHVVSTLNPTTNNISTYVNGSSKSITYGAQQTPNPFTNFAQNVFIGANNSEGSTNNRYNGLLDEVRISSVIRSAGWIDTEYNNQNNPGGFYSIGAQSPAGSATIIAGANNIIFNNFNVSSNAGGGKFLRFKSGGTYTFAGTFSASGEPGNILAISGTQVASPWIATFSSSAILNYASVRDSNCTGGNNMTGSFTNVNLGNNGACFVFKSLNGGVSGVSGAGGESGSGGGGPVGGGGQGGGGGGAGGEQQGGGLTGTCSDGQQNGNETGVDTGGRCGATGGGAGGGAGGDSGFLLPGGSNFASAGSANVPIGTPQKIVLGIALFGLLVVFGRFLI